MLTTRQREALDFIARFIEARGQAPTLAEMQRHFRLRSPATAHKLLAALERAGAIRRTPNVSRGIEVVAPPAPEAEGEIPLLGVIAAGRPIEAVLTQDSVRVPSDMIGARRTFALRVRGDSMIDEHICDGDLIVVEARPTAENGQTVVALIGDEATVKRFYRERGRVRLEPANPRYKPIYVKPPDRLRIQGVVVGVIRRYPG